MISHSILISTLFMRVCLHFIFMIIQTMFASIGFYPRPLHEIRLLHTFKYMANCIRLLSFSWQMISQLYLSRAKGFTPFKWLFTSFMAYCWKARLWSRHLIRTIYHDHLQLLNKRKSKGFPPLSFSKQRSWPLIVIKIKRSIFSLKTTSHIFNWLRWRLLSGQFNIEISLQITHDLPK